MKKYLDIVKKDFSSEDDVDKIISKLKKNGATQIETVKALVETLNIPLIEAHKLVLNSKAWKTLKDTNTLLKNKFFENNV